MVQRLSIMKRTTFFFLRISSQSAHEIRLLELSRRHGKGVPDGIGASIKRLADKLVLWEGNITEAATMYNLREENIATQLYHVIDTERYVDILPQHKLQTDPGTVYIIHCLCRNEASITAFVILPRHSNLQHQPCVVTGLIMEKIQLMAWSWLTLCTRNNSSGLSSWNVWMLLDVVAVLHVILTCKTRLKKYVAVTRSLM